jgi:hypothetical protein
MIERLKQLPGAAWATAHPRLSAWIVLALGMVILLAIEAREWIALIVVTILVAGACIWIVTWDDDDNEDED